MLLFFCLFLTKKIEGLKLKIVLYLERMPPFDEIGDSLRLLCFTLTTALAAKERLNVEKKRNIENVSRNMSSWECAILRFVDRVRFIFSSILRFPFTGEPHCK